ncbi:peroxisome proliferator-activated receptor gamma coactivator-related protein 1 isoform X2 [Lissotriton helveticus]
MAARWGARARKRSIGTMDLFTSGSPSQCHALEEDSNYSGISDLGLSSFDTSELLGTFRGYLDPTIISIIEGAGSQCESKSRFDDENELSLLTALTEILDNADDENLSPFDSIPDTELLVSQKDRDSSLQRFINLSRSPPDHSILTVDEHKLFKSNGGVAAFGKGETRTEDSWDMFPDCLNSTPVRHNKVKSIRKSVQKVREVPLQSSDGEEKIYSPEHDTSSESSIDCVDFGLDFINELSSVSTLRPEETKSKHGTPYIINTANVSLGDLVKYMHSYCIPSRTLCVEPVNTELEEDFLSNGVVLEIEDCFSAPTLVKDSRPEFTDKLSMKNICSVEKVDSKITVSSPGLEKECQMVEDSSIQERAEQSKELQIGDGMKEVEPDGDSKPTLQTEVRIEKSLKSKELQGEFKMGSADDKLPPLQGELGFDESAESKEMSLNGELGKANQTLELNISIPTLQLQSKDQAENNQDTILGATHKTESEGASQACIKSAEHKGQVGELEKVAGASMQDSEMEDTEPNFVADKLYLNCVLGKDENMPAQYTDAACPNMHCKVQTEGTLVESVKGEASESNLKALAPLENSLSQAFCIKNVLQTKSQQSEAAVKHSTEMAQEAPLQDSSTNCQTSGGQETSILQAENANGFGNLSDSLKKLPENVETAAADCTLTVKKKCNLQKHSTKMLTKSQKKKESQNVNKQVYVPQKPSTTAQVQETACDENKLQKAGSHQTSSLSSPSLKESDLLIKQLEQAKKESQMELKLLKASRVMKSRARSNLENSSGLSSLDKKASPLKGRDIGLSPKEEKEGIQPTLVNTDALGPSEQTLGSKEHFECTHSNTVIESSNISLGDINNLTPYSTDGQVKCDTYADPISNDTSVEVEGEKSASIEVEGEDSTSVEEETDQNQTKDVKPKSLSLKEYRMRMQQRKASADDKKEHENLSNKWPSLPEPPTELAEIPCLMKPKMPSVSRSTLANIKLCQEPNVLESPESPVLESSGNALTEVPPVEGHNTQTPPSCLQHSQSIDSSPVVGVPQLPQPPCALYTEPPPNLWPPIVSQSVGYPFPPPLPPPPGPCVSSNAFHAVPIPPAPILSWPPPFPPPPIGSGPFHTYPPGWRACLPPPPSLPPPPLPPPPLPPSYWPSVPMPPTIPPLMYCDRGPPAHGPSRVSFPPSVPSAPMQRVEFPSTNQTNLNPSLLQSVEQKTPSISYQELADVLQNVHNMATRTNGKTPDLFKPADHIKSGINLMAPNHGKTESTASAQSSSDKISFLKKTGHQVFSSETSAKQTTAQKSYPAESEVPAYTVSQTLPNTQQNIRGEVVKQKIPQSTNEIVLKIFELLRKAQKPSCSQDKVVSDTPKHQIDTQASSMPMSDSPVQAASQCVLQMSDGFQTSVRSVQARPHSDRECIDSKPLKQSSDEAVTSMTLKPQSSLQIVGTMPLKTMAIQESALTVMQKSLSVVPPDTLRPSVPMADSKLQNVVPLVVEKPQGLVKDPLPVQKPQVALPNPLAVQKPQCGVQEPLEVQKSHCVVHTQSVQKPQGIAFPTAPKPSLAVQRPQDVDPALSAGQGALPVHQGVVPASVQKPESAVLATSAVQMPEVADRSPLTQKPQCSVQASSSVQNPQAVVSVASAAQKPELVGPSVAQKLQAVHLATRRSQVAPLTIPSVYEKSKVKRSRNTTNKRGVIGKEKAKEEKHCSQSPGDNLAVGNSRFETGVQNKPLDTLLAPGFGSTAELTPPATPPHQPLSSVTLLGKPSILNAALQEGTINSPLKTVKLIEAKPLPVSKLRKRNSAIDVPQAPTVHVGYGEHDYCFLSTSQPESSLDATQLKTGPTPLQSAASASEGSRWNVKHHQSIVIKPIISITKRSQNKDCPEQDKGSGKSIPCSPLKSLMHSDSVPTKDCKDQLDHRTSETNNANIDCSSTSVLMSPEASPCNSDGGESRTQDQRGNAAASKRSLRCYRKHKDSASLQSSGWRRRRTHTSRSCSSSCSSSDGEDSSSVSSSSSSRSRSRSAPPKKRRRYNSRNSHKSRSSSRSSCGSCGRSRGRSSSASTTYSSRSYSTSYSRSRSRSRSRSPYSRRYEYYDRANYRKRRVPQQERAIEERRVVYIGKIPGVMTRAELKHRFSVFGTIEECNIHFRDHGDNYGFVTYRYTEDAFTAIENGHKLRRPDELPFDLCFGGRRQFCKSNYADLDSNRGEYDPVKNKFESLDFDTLLKQAQKSIRR